MVDAWLVAVAVIGSLMLFAVSLYILVYYQHPDDRNQAYGPKVIVVVSLTLSELVVLLFALDVSNRNGIVGCGQ